MSQDRFGQQRLQDFAYYYLEHIADYDDIKQIECEGSEAYNVLKQAGMSMTFEDAVRIQDGASAKRDSKVLTKKFNKILKKK